MSQAINLSDELVVNARQTSEIAQRSVAGQIEYWAQLGRAIEPLLQQSQALEQRSVAHPISECLESVDSEEGRQRVAEYLQGQPFPHYESVSDSPGLFIRIEEDGARTVGRFVDRQFKEAD